MKSKTFNISLPEELLKKADEVAKVEFRNRSELIREALRVYLKNAQEWDELFEYGQNMAKKLKIDSPEEIDKAVYAWRHRK